MPRPPRHALILTAPGACSAGLVKARRRLADSSSGNPIRGGILIVDRRRLPLVAAALVLALGIADAVIFTSAGGANAAPRGTGTPSDTIASSLIGTWTGMKSGAEGGTFYQEPGTKDGAAVIALLRRASE